MLNMRQEQEDKSLKCEEKDKIITDLKQIIERHAREEERLLNEQVCNFNMGCSLRTRGRGHRQKTL